VRLSIRKSQDYYWRTPLYALLHLSLKVAASIPWIGGVPSGNHTQLEWEVEDSKSSACANAKSATITDWTSCPRRT